MPFVWTPAVARMSHAHDTQVHLGKCGPLVLNRWAVVLVFDGVVGYFDGLV
jgi:hypothetical protein